MRKLLSVGLLLLLTGCWSWPFSPNRTVSNQIGTVAANDQTNLNDRAAGNNAAIGYTAAKLPDSREKEVIQSFVSDQYGILGQPKLTTKTAFEKAADELLSTDAAKRAQGEADRVKLSTDNLALKAALDKANADFAAQRKLEETAHAQEIEKIKLDAANAQRKLVSYIFFGGSALLLVAGIAVLVLSSSYPIFGPKAAFGLIGASVIGAVMGVAILQLMSELDKHPWILWVGGGSIIAILTGVGALLYANHAHNVNPVKPNV